MPERELVYYVATTLDGFIARDDGSLRGFVWDAEFVAALFKLFPETFPAHLRKDLGDPVPNKAFDAVLMGRRTYEVGLQEGITNPYPTLDQYVFSRTMDADPDENVELVSEDASSAVEELKHQRGKAIWLCGGSELATTLYEAGLIDRLIVKLNPVVFGSGIPLFSAEIDPATLKLKDNKVYPSGHVLLDYEIN